MQNDSTYREICNNVRVTDDISFKLLSLVPLVSGSAVLVLVMKADIFWSPGMFCGVATAEVELGAGEFAGKQT